MARLREGFVSGVVDDNPLTISATTLNSSGLSDLPAVASPDIAAIILDPEGTAGAPEIVHVTAHTASATSATISRGQENTTARQHAQGVAWVHGPTIEDFAPQGPRGWLGYDILTTIRNPGATEADLISVTVNVGISRLIKVTFFGVCNVSLSSGDTNSQVVVKLYEDTTRLQTSINQWRDQDNADSGQQHVAVPIIHVLEASGQHTYKVTDQRFSNDVAQWDLSGDAVMLLVEDLGPA